MNKVTITEENDRLHMDCSGTAHTIIGMIGYALIAAIKELPVTNKDKKEIIDNLINAVSIEVFRGEKDEPGT